MVFVYVYVRKMAEVYTLLAYYRFCSLGRRAPERVRGHALRAGRYRGKRKGKRAREGRGTRTEACEKRKGENGNEEKNEEKNDGMRGSREKVDSTDRKRKRQKERKTEEIEEKISRKKNGGKEE